MPKYRDNLPHLDGRLFLTDGGIETTLIFQEHVPLREFASFDLLQSDEGTEILARCYRPYAELARRFRTGLLLESPSWRASPVWGAKLGYSLKELEAVNRKSIRLLEGLREEFESEETPVILSGCLGPRGDGYVPEVAMADEEAEAYHAAQIEVFADFNADLICAMTMNYVEEAAGIAQACRKIGMPVVISFTVETDGRLPTGDSLQTAIRHVDEATAAYPLYYMVNCAHPTHFASVLGEHELCARRIRGIRANASRKSHAELNESTELDPGNPVEFGGEYADLKRRIPGLSVLGGCCGTDHRHVEQIAVACAPLFQGD